MKNSEEGCILQAQQAELKGKVALQTALGWTDEQIEAILKEASN